MKHILLTIFLILGETAVSAAERETWLCTGFKASSDGTSLLGPFIMYGNQKKYEMAYYIMRNSDNVDKLRIINFVAPSKATSSHYFETECLRQ